MASLFDDIPHNSNKEDLIRISLPKDFKPNDFTEEEILVIKMLAIVNTPLPKTTCKNMAKAVIDGLFYPKIKKGTIDLAIENLVNKKVLLPYDNGYILNLDLSIQLYELVKHDTFLIKRILEFFKEQFYYYRDMAIRLAIMVNDFQFVEEKVFSYSYLLRDTPVICFRNIFMELGDFSYVRITSYNVCYTKLLRNRIFNMRT